MQSIGPRAGVWAVATLTFLARGPGAWRGADAYAPAGADARHARRAAAMAVRWRSAAPRADAAVLERWGDAVGAPVYSPVPARLPDAGSDTLVVVSWNVHVGGGDVPRLVRDVRSGRLTGGHPVRQLVLLLQEAYRAGADLPRDPSPNAVPHRIAPSPSGDPRIDVVALARELGLALLYVPSMRNGMEAAVDESLAEDRGNAILSSLPLSDPLALELPFQAQRRVPVLATVSGRTGRGERWRLRVAAVHLDNRTAWRRPLASLGAARTEQARVLAAALAREPTLVVGADLNTWSWSVLEGAVRHLRQQFPATPPEPRQGTYELLGITRRLDHMFFRLPPGWQAAVERVNDRYGSDHYPLLARIVMPRGMTGR